MMTIHINKNAAGLNAYFLNSLSKEDYHFSGKADPGRWHGALAKALGLPDKVSQKDFSALAHNKHPQTKEKLTPRNAAERRTSIEYQFACPKSVSLVMALSGKDKRKAIINAHRLAVKKAMQAIEKDMQAQTRINGKKTYVTTGKIVYARFDHYTSRPTKDKNNELARFTSDMQLHSHCVVFNVSKLGENFRALEGSTIHRNAVYYQNLYHSNLSKSLQNLGYEIERNNHRYEIKGFTRRTIEKFSQRTVEIEKFAKKYGITNAKIKSELGAKIRVNKSKVKEEVNLRKVWEARLTAREQYLIQNAQKDNPKLLNPLNPTQAINMALAHHLERNSTIATKKLLASAMAYGYGALTPESIDKALQKKTDILYAKRGYIEYLTTKDMVRQENRMLDFATRGKNIRVPLNPNYTIKRDFLNETQRNAIHQILRSKDNVQLLLGYGGVGKSTLLVEIKEAAEEKGKHIVALASSSAASRDVLRSKGFKDADTIATFLKNEELREKARNQIILVDEASLVGVGALNKIFDTAKQLNARVILSGDPKQHVSVEAGDGLKLLTQKANLKIAFVDKILRQQKQPKLQKAIEDLATGNMRKGYDRLDKDLGAIVEIEDVSKRHQQIAKDYVRSLEAGRSALVVSPTHGEGRLLVEVVRAEMKHRGRIGKEEKSYTIQRNLSLTETQKQDAAMYEPEYIIQFHQNARGGFKAGEKYTVTSKNDRGQVFVKSKDENNKLLPFDTSERFQVFQADKIALSKGDLIRITLNGRSLEKARLHNGQVYKIQDLDIAGNIHLSNGKTLDKDYANFNYAYVSTSHAVQGKDAQDVFIAQSAMSFTATNDKQFYVSASRAKEYVQIYTDDKEALREAVSRSGNRMSALEIASHQKQRLRKNIQNRNRRHYLLDTTKKITKDERVKKSTHRQIFASDRTPDLTRE